MFFHHNYSKIYDKIILCTHSITLGLLLKVHTHARACVHICTHTGNYTLGRHKCKLMFAQKHANECSQSFTCRRQSWKSQSQKVTRCMIPFMYYFWSNTITGEARLVFARGEGGGKATGVAIKSDTWGPCAKGKLLYLDSISAETLVVMRCKMLSLRKLGQGHVGSFCIIAHIYIWTHNDLKTNTV